MSPVSESERREGIDLIAAANHRMAERAKAPGWYHWVLGLLLGGWAAAWELPLPLPFAYPVVLGLGAVLLVRAYIRHTGMWISGYRAGRTRWVSVSVAMIGAVLQLTATWLILEKGLHGAGIVAGVLIAAVTTAAGYLWEKAYRRDLGVESR